MTKPLEFTLKSLATKPKLNASLAERTQGVPALMESRKVKPAPTLAFHSDFNGDGVRDSFELQIKEGPQVALQCIPNHCTLWAPQGAQGVAKLIPGDMNQDGSADFYIETQEGQAFALENKMEVPPTVLTRDEYRTHLKTLRTQLQRKETWWDAVRTSIGLTYGISHTWVVPEPKPRYPWIDGTPRHTDCVIDFERTMAELHAPTAAFSDFQKKFKVVQFHDYNGHPERTDFFTAEAVPHLSALGMISDRTADFFKKLRPGTATPTFTATINKENWYKGLHNGQASGKDFPEWKFEMGYIPFADMFSATNDGKLALNKNLADQLPPVSIIVAMNKGRIFKALGTEIPDSHVAYLIKDPKSGEVYVHHSTPTTDLNLATVTTEDLSSFMQLRYCHAPDGTVVPKDKTAVGIKILTVVPPRKTTKR